MKRDAGESVSLDLELLRATARGDERSFSRLYDRHGPILFGLLLRMLGNRQEAEDVLQEAFVQVWQHATEFDPSRGRPQTWMTLLARSRALDRLRSRTSRQRVTRELAAEPQGTVEDPAGTVARSELGKTVRKALQELPADQQEALRMAYFQGLSQSEIAEALNRPLGTVKTQIRSGMAKLKAFLTGDER